VFVADVRQESDEADDTDDEVDNWERQQLQKAIRQRQVQFSFICKENVSILQVTR